MFGWNIHHVLQNFCHILIKQIIQMHSAAEILFSKCIFTLSEVLDHRPKFHTHLYKHVLFYSCTTENKDGSRRTSEIIINV